MHRKTLNSILLLLLVALPNRPSIAASEDELPPPSRERAVTALTSRAASAGEIPVPQPHDSSQAAIDLARRVRELRETGQLEAAGKIRSPWTQPNFVVQLGSELVAPGELPDPFTNTSAVAETILGTSIHGQSQTAGRISTHLVPRNSAAEIDVVLRGKTVTQSRGVNGPATLITSSNGQFTAISRIKISEQGISYTPPRASATNRSTLHDVQVASRMLPGLVESIARRRAEGLQSQADAIAARRAEARYEEAMNRQLGAGIERANRAYRTKVLDPLAARGALWESVRFQSTADALHIRMLYADGIEPAANGAPPALSDKNVLAFQAHESLVRNAAQMLLRGKSLSDHTLAEGMKILLGEIPREAREFRLGDHLEPWSVAFADDHPLAVEFSDRHIELGMRLARLTIGDRTMPAPILVEASYLVQFTAHGPRLQRVGDVRVSLDPRETIHPSSEVSEFLERKARSLFLSELWFDGLVPPTGGPFEKVAQLALTELSVGQGWISLGFGHSPQPLQTALHTARPVRP